MPFDDEGWVLVAIVREFGTAMGALPDRSHLSVQETAVGHFVALACKGGSVATTSGTAPVTTRYRPTHGINRVGIDRRAQLVARIA
jgi:hypothetical protein